MNPNKLYCQANKAVIEELDSRVAALEQGGGGGTEYTAGEGIDITNDVISVDSETIYDKTDVDGLLDEKQGVLTAGDGINITDDVISLDNGWKEVEASELYVDKFDFDRYDYKMEGKVTISDTNTNATLFVIGKSGTAGRYYGIIIEEDASACYHNVVITPTASGITQGIVEFYISGATHGGANNFLTLKDFDGTIIDASNFTTYFDTTQMKCIKSCVASLKISTNVNGNTIVMPNDTNISIFGMNGTNMYGLKQTVSNLKKVIVDGSTTDTYRPDYFEFRLKNNRTITINKYYRRLKI